MDNNSHHNHAFVKALNRKDEKLCVWLIENKLVNFNYRFATFCHRTLIHLIILWENDNNLLNSALSSNLEINLDIIDDNGLAPLHLAIFLKNYKAFKLLIQSGANHLAYKIHPLKCLHYEDRHKKTKLMDFIHSHILLNDSNIIEDEFEEIQEKAIFVENLNYKKMKNC
jgi:ankyrin repeat protein